MTHPASISGRGVTRPPIIANMEFPGCRCVACHERLTSTHKAMDAAAEVDPDRDTELNGQTKVAKAGQRIAENRLNSGTDDEPHVPGCMCKPCVKARDAERDRKVKGVVGVMDKLVRLTNKKRAADAKRAWDAGLKRYRIEGERADKRINDTFRASVRASRDRWLGKAKDAEPDLDIQVAEELPAMVDIDGAEAYKIQHNEAGARLRARYERNQPSPTVPPVQRAIDPYEDRAPMSPETRLQEEHRIARARLEARRN